MFKREAKLMILILSPILILAVIGTIMLSLNGRIKICKQLQKGIKKETLVKYFGEPIGKENEWILFKSSPLAAGPIRAKIDSVSNKVSALKCTEDGNIEWELTEKK